MKLDDLQSPMNSVQLAQLLKKHHGIQLPVAQLTPARAQGMLESVQTQLNQYRNSKSAHLSEQDSNYTAMMLVEQTLRARISEGSIFGPLSKMGNQRSLLSPDSSIGQAWTNIKDATGLRRHGTTGPSANDLVKTVMGTGEKKKKSLADFTSEAGIDPRELKASLQIAKKNPDNIDPRTAKILYTALIKNIGPSALSESARLNESAMGEAEVILAAKDLADRVQDMVETLGKMINEELPALTETIRDTMEATQADTYNTSALESLNATLEAVRGSKESLDVAARSLAGEEPAAPVDAGTDEFSGDVTEPELGAEDTDEVADELMNTPAVASGGKKQPLGRGKR